MIIRCLLTDDKQLDEYSHDLTTVISVLTLHLSMRELWTASIGLKSVIIKLDHNRFHIYISADFEEDQETLDDILVMG